MDPCSECCSSQDEFLPESGPQHTILSLPRMIRPLSPTSPSFGSGNGKSPANPYQMLQIRRDATAMEIRQSYKRLALWHHPGRKQAEDITQQERRRRFQVFNLLAACYETLINMDSRRRYDNICRELEQAKLQAGVRGAMYVGGKSLVGNASIIYDAQYRVAAAGASLLSINNSLLRDRGKEGETDRIPPLSRASSTSSTSMEEENRLEHDEAHSSCCTASGATTKSDGSPSRRAGNRIVTAATITTNRSAAVAPSLVDSTSSEEEDEAEAHFTETTTQRLFGGPLSHLFKARNFEPFSDPYDVFEEVFGRQPFPRVSREEIGQVKDSAWMPRTSPRDPAPLSPTSPVSPAGWRGESQTSPDGKTIVFTTSRVLHDRRLTRKETVVRVSRNKTETRIEVTAEPLTPPRGILADDNDSPPTNVCLICERAIPEGSPEEKQVESPLAETKSNTLCADVCELYQNAWQGVDFSENSFFQEWQNIFPNVFPGTAAGFAEGSI